MNVFMVVAAAAALIVVVVVAACVAVAGQGPESVDDADESPWAAVPSSRDVAPVHEPHRLAGSLAGSHGTSREDGSGVSVDLLT